MTRILPLLLPLASSLACSGKGQETPASTAPTWSADIGPLYARACLGCHADGGAAPFSLGRYDDAAAWAVASAAAVQARTMPPFLVRGDGTCGEYIDNQWLSDEEIALVAAWAEAGAPEGEPGRSFEAPALAVLPEGATRYLTPDFVPEIVGGSYAENDEYRCFDLGTVDEDRFLVGYEVSPGNTAMVHHLLVMPVDPDEPAAGGRTAAEQMALLDEQDEREGWPCFTGAGNGVPTLSTPVAWAPGQGAVLFPEGSGVAVPAGHRLIAQVHYNLVDPSIRGQSDQTAVDLLFADEVENEAFIALPDGFLERLGAFNEPSIPVGEEAWTFTWEREAWELLYDYGGSTEGLTGGAIAGVIPHMHEFGSSMRVELDGQCMADVPRWDFAWQRLYFYQEPWAVRGDELLTVSCTWNTEEATEPVGPGWGTGDEMCLAALYVVLYRD